MDTELPTSTTDRREPDRPGRRVRRAAGERLPPSFVLPIPLAASAVLRHGLLVGLLVGFPVGVLADFEVRADLPPPSSHRSSASPFSTGPVTASSPPSPLPDLPAADLARLEAGEAVVRMEGAEDEIGEGRAWRILEAPAERLFRAVADWRHYAEFFPFVVASEAEAEGDGDDAVLSHQRIDLPFPFADRTFTATTTREVETTPAGGRIYRVAWSHVPGSGNVTANRGAWTLRERAPGRTLVELRLLSDTGPTVPPSLQRRALAETLPWALDGLRQQVNRCRYDLPIHPTCAEAPPFPAVGGEAGGGPPAAAPPPRRQGVPQGGVPRGGVPRGGVPRGGAPRGEAPAGGAAEGAGGAP